MGEWGMLYNVIKQSRKLLHKNQGLNLYLCYDLEMALTKRQMASLGKLKILRFSLGVTLNKGCSIWSCQAGGKVEDHTDKIHGCSAGGHVEG